MTSHPPLLVLGSDPAFARAVSDVLAAHLPHLKCDVVDLATLRSRPNATAAVIDARTDRARGAATAERLRAIGFESAIVLVASPLAGPAPTATETGASPRAMGFAEVAPDELPEQLFPRLAEQMEAAHAPHADLVMRARRVVAAGQIALRLQHALNNPIAGLMAEAQLMQFETVTPEQAAALQRMVDLCRRLVELTRSLDGIADRRPRPT
jgi:signal transduction histidine kinase